MQPDALIMSDPGLIMLVREKWPTMPIHLSVQASVNYASVQFWAKQGIERVILFARTVARRNCRNTQALPKYRVGNICPWCLVYGTLGAVYCRVT